MERGFIMISKLRKIYSSLIVYLDDIDHFDSEYKWFITAEQEIIGVRKDELTTKDTSILSAFLNPYNIDFPVSTELEKKWKQIVYKDEKNAAFELINPYRFVYFSIKENQINPATFKDAIQELFSEEIPILWITNHEGVIIEEQHITRESISYEHIIDILMSDLSVYISFFVGPYQKGLDDVKIYFDHIISGAETAFDYSKKSVVTFTEVVPFLFVSQMNPELRLDITKIILQDFINDDETLKMIHAFVQCNLNVSETAKELYMHRNSLQYRLDRFYEKTSIDIRQFQNAMTVYLALIANN